MNHPIYTNKGMNINRDIFLKSVKIQGYLKSAKDMATILSEKSPLTKEELGPLIQAVLMGYIIQGEIAQSGHVLMKGKMEDWDSETSQKTLAKTDLSRFKFPFKAGTIMMGDKQLDFMFGDINGTEAFYIRHESVHGTIVMQIHPGRQIGEEMERSGMSKENEVLIYSVLSYLLYVAMFNTESKVISETQPKTQGSKRKFIPKHKVNIITLKQTVSKNGSTGVKNENRAKNEKFWIVRGHWRNQWYAIEQVHKPKWMNPYFKGEGKEEIRKVYKA